MALQMLYQSDLGGSSLPQIFTTFDVEEYLAPAKRGAGSEGKKALAKGTQGKRTQGKKRAGKNDREPSAGKPEALVGSRRRKQIHEAFEYARTLVEGTLEHGDEIDGLIREQADNWRLERMPAVDRNILRLAIFEMLYQQDVPKLVVVDEAIELAKRFGSEQSGRFVNGLLDGLLKQHPFPGRLK